MKFTLLSISSIICVLISIQICFAKEKSVLIVIRSQANEYHHRIATEKKAELDAQIEKDDLSASVTLLHREWPVENAWLILPLMPDIARKYSEQFQWIMFIEDGTNIDVQQLILNVLSRYDHKEEIYFGRCLYDNQVSIIHHFAFHDGKVKEFFYPDFHAGWIMSSSLVTKIGKNWSTNEKRSDFQIDIQHEIAMFLNSNFDIKMKCVKEICGVQDSPQCVTWIDPKIPDCGKTIGLEDVFIAVKTTKMFHKDRLPIVKATWGKYAKNIIYYSNITDPEIPTVDCGVPNTVRGHCGKMEAIIMDSYKNKDINSFPWLVIADDDSIIGLSALVKLLNCYNPQTPVVIGERYGFGLEAGRGYGYITGGGSMIMSRAAVNEWVKKDCSCPSLDTPDDMFLGMCFSYNVGIPVTHSPRFHQARPDDYSDGYLGNLQPVSFHKHWEIDPINVYKTWFGDDDETAFGSSELVEPTQAPELVAIPIPPTPTEAATKDEL